MIQKMLQIFGETGMAGLVNRAIAFAYRRWVRPLLPLLGPVHYAGIPVAYDWRWGDRSIPATWRPGAVQDIPNYEGSLVAGLTEHVRQGDRVVVIGGGVGVTATIAAMKAGGSSVVHCFEGSSEGVEKIRKTALRNGVMERLEVHHAVVARSISVYGTEPAGAVVNPVDLPECDVLELDCEGAEVDILRAMRIRPRVVLVETHGQYGAPTVLVSSLLNERGYSVIWQGIAELCNREYCEMHDVQVLVCVLRRECASE
jgi:hypothetical protein